MVPRRRPVAADGSPRTDARMPPSRKARPEPPVWRPLAGFRVLVADDARGTRRLYEAALANAGAEVTTVADGDEAVAAWSAAAGDAPFVAAVLDFVMPGRDGAEVAAVLRAAGFRGAIVGVSAELSEADAGRWLEAGCDEVLAKGVSLAGLVARVAAAGGRRGEAEPPPGRPR